MENSVDIIALIVYVMLEQRSSFQYLGVWVCLRKQVRKVTPTQIAYVVTRSIELYYIDALLLNCNNFLIYLFV